MLVSVSDNAREALRAALGDRQAAEAALTAARETTGRARLMLEAIVREGEKTDADGRRAADTLADEIRAAIAAGASPPAADMSKSAAARSDLDARRAMVERIVAEFTAAEHEAEQALSGATAAVERAVEKVLRSEVETIASRWAKADREARALRLMLGRESDPIWRMNGLSDEAHEALVANARDPDLGLEECRVVRAAWENLAAELATSADARPDFADADREIARLRREREDRQAAQEAFVERMRERAA
jgi:hypothetical protein